MDMFLISSEWFKNNIRHTGIHNVDDYGQSIFLSSMSADEEGVVNYYDYLPLRRS